MTFESSNPEPGARTVVADKGGHTSSISSNSSSELDVQNIYVSKSDNVLLKTTVNNTPDANDADTTATTWPAKIMDGEMLHEQVPSQDESLQKTLQNEQNRNGAEQICLNGALDDEIRSRLDKLNALSDLINSLEHQFDEANSLFRETLKCSTDRLSSIAKTLGTKSIGHGRVYLAAKLSLEQSQSDCQRACLQFEQANNDHQFAKLAIKEAETKLREMTGDIVKDVIALPNIGIESLDLEKLNLTDAPDQVHHDDQLSSSSPRIAGEKCRDAALLGENLNQAIAKLLEAEKKRSQSERQHLDQASRLMIAQENLLKLERQYGPSIRRSKLYFDEAKRFDARLNSVKADICRTSEEILAAKRAYAQTLSELEQFSEHIHDSLAQ